MHPSCKANTSGLLRTPCVVVVDSDIVVVSVPFVSVFASPQSGTRPIQRPIIIRLIVPFAWLHDLSDFGGSLSHNNHSN